MKDVDYRGSGEGRSRSAETGWRRHLYSTNHKDIETTCLGGCDLLGTDRLYRFIARLWKYQLVLTSARDRSIGCLRSISSERHPVYDRLGGVAFRAANPPEGSMREHRRLS